MNTALKILVQDIFQSKLEEVVKEYPEEINGIYAVSDLALRKVEALVESNEKKILANIELAKKEIAIASRFYIIDFSCKWFKK